MTDGEILHIALEQSAIDCGCSASDFLSPANTVVVSRADPRARRYLELPFDCDLTCYGNGIVASVAGPLTEPVRGYIDRYPAEHCFETPNLLVLANRSRTIRPARLLYGGILPAPRRPASAVLRAGDPVPDAVRFCGTLPAAMEQRAL